MGSQVSQLLIAQRQQDPAAHLFLLATTIIHSKGTTASSAGWAWL